MRGVAEGKVASKTIELPNGRAFQVINTPLAQGGWVATIEEITERRNLEQERDRNYTFLREIIDHIPSQITVKDAATANICWSTASPRSSSASRATTSSARPPSTSTRATPPGSSPTTTARRCSRRRDCSRTSIAWQSQTHGAALHHLDPDRHPRPSGEPRYLINVVEDVTERRRADEKIAHMAHYDALTDLPNRALFREQIERELEKVAGGEQFALLYIDIDEFKGINDSLGHHVGDELLKAVAGRIRGCLRQSDLIARLGGDEFAVIQTGDRIVRRRAVDFVTRIHEAIRRPYHCLGHQLSTDASIGIAMAPQDGTDLDQLIKNADLAMYGAKAEGRRTYRFFEPEMDASAKARLTLEQDLRQALVDGGFEIHYQPLVNLAADEVSGCEALLRWRHPERGMVSPAEFIPIAEDTGLINELGDWVLRTACTEAATWPGRMCASRSTSRRCSSNATRWRCGSPARWPPPGLQPRRLELEITEAVLIRDDEAALSILHQLRAHRRAHRARRFRHRLFLAELSEALPVRQDQDRPLLRRRHRRADGSPVIVQAVVNIAAARNMTTVAEGVETEAQREMLRALGCTEMQGYLFSTPKPAAEVRKLFGPGDAMPVAAVA